MNHNYALNPIEDANKYELSVWSFNPKRFPLPIAGLTQVIYLTTENFIN